jgi:hypothetical protein
MQPSPKAETSRPLIPSFLVFIARLSWPTGRVLGHGFSRHGGCPRCLVHRGGGTWENSDFGESDKSSLMLQFRQQDLGLGGQRIRAIHVA